VTPQGRDRVAGRAPERDRLAAEVEPLGDGLRDGDRQVPCGQGLEDRLGVGGPFGLGQRLRGQFGRARAAFALGDPDGELCVQAGPGGVFARRKQGYGALADPGDGAVGGRADAVDDQARLGEQVGPADRLGEVGGGRAAADAALDRVGEEQCLGQPDEQPRPLGVTGTGLLSAAEREFGVANRVVVGQRPPGLQIGSSGPDLALPGRVPAPSATPVGRDDPGDVGLADPGEQLRGPAVQAGAAARRQLGVDRVADQRVLKPQLPGRDIFAEDASRHRLVERRSQVRTPGHFSQRRGVDAFGEDAGRVDHGPGLLGELAGPRHDETAQLRPFCHQSPCITVRGQVVGDQPDEQRVAAGALPQRLGELRVG
jgi:hypothetical protein